MSRGFTPAGLLGALRRLCHVGWTRKWGRTIPRHRRRLESLVRLERLEPRMLLAIDVVDVGANVELTGLGVDPTTGDVTIGWDGNCRWGGGCEGLLSFWR